ncbi:MAG TPA: hypothetical protein VMS11_10995 [Solirubrobacterales bacterium]|nr:hypothetical protein [Solirubrobacterales bacterium]
MYVLADRDWVGVPQILTALLLGGAAAVLLFASFGGGTGRPGSDLVAARTGAPAPAPIAVRHERAGERFEVAGASFLVARRPLGAWGGAARRLVAPRGERLLVIAVTVVNRGRHAFNPGLLSYLVRGPEGTILAPLRAGAVGPNGLGRTGGLPLGAAAEERLVFALPDRLRDPVLAIQPSPVRALEVRISLD